MPHGAIWVIVGIILIVELFTHYRDLASWRWTPGRRGGEDTIPVLHLAVTANHDYTHPLTPGTLITLTGTVREDIPGYTLQWWTNEELRFQWPGPRAQMSLMHFVETTDCVFIRVIHDTTGIIAAESDPLLITWANPTEEDTNAIRQ